MLNSNTLITPPMLPTTLPLATGMLNSVVPFSSLDAAPTLLLAVTPVSPEPLPIKMPFMTWMLPVAVRPPVRLALLAATLPV